MFRIICDKIGIPLDPYTNYKYSGGWWKETGDSGGSGGGETEVTLSRISATYSGGDVAAGTSVTALTGIVVKAHYSDGSSKTVTGYTLSGTIAEGSNVVTVTYEGKTATITVTGIGETEITLSRISATYSGGDVAVGTSVTALTGIVVKAHYSDGSSKTVTGYTLSGTIEEGSNVVTVTYEGKTATITVTGIGESEFTVLLDNGVTGGGVFTAWNESIIPVMQMAQYDATAKTTLFSGKTLRKIQLGGNGFTGGTATIVTQTLETFDAGTLNMENQITVTVGNDGMIDFGDSGFVIPENHTLAMFTPSDSIRACYLQDATSENYMYTAANWKASSKPAPIIRLIAVFWV